MASGESAGRKPGGWDEIEVGEVRKDAPVGVHRQFALHVDLICRTAVYVTRSYGGVGGGGREAFPYPIGRLAQGAAWSNELMTRTSICTTTPHQIPPEDLVSASLRLGRYRDTNDPKERKDWHFSVGTNVVGRNLDHPIAQGMSDWLSATLKASTRLACFCMDSPPLTGDHLREIFNRGYCKPRMWAQYGASHTGVCLIFRKDRLVEAARKRFGQSVPLLFGPVRYINRPIVPKLFSPDEQQYMINLDVLEEIGREQYLLRHIGTHYQRLFFEKMTDWENESGE
jgi:hypothetical protein